MSEQASIVTGVHIFPIKSCQEATVNGQLPSELTVGETGFAQNGFVDRGIVIAGADMLFAPQRGWDNLDTEHKGYPKDTRLATVAVDIQPDHLRVTTPGLGSLEIGKPDESQHGSQEIRMFGNPFFGYDMGPEGQNYFSRVVEREVRLFWVDQDKPRYLNNPEYFRADAVNRTAGADGFPFLLTNHASLGELHTQAELPHGTLSITAYRGNIEVDLGEAWAEDRIRYFRIRNFAGYVVKACSRCPIPNQDQKTGERHGLSNKLLRSTRMGWHTGKDPAADPPKPYFGQNVNHVTASVGTSIAEGDPITVDEWDDPNVVFKQPRVS